MGQGGFVDALGVGGGVGPGLDDDRLARIGGDAGQALGRQFRPHIIKDGGGDGLGLDRGQGHGDQPAHGGAEEDGLLDP
ncbi:hypothetical protein D3C80_1966600 [compost metagenome]